MMEADAIIRFVTDRLNTLPELKALFLSGSYGSGQADVYSDIDFYAVVARQDDKRHFVDVWRTIIAEINEIVLWRELGDNDVLINAVLADWCRIDVFIVTDHRPAALAQDKVKVLIDHARIFDTLPDSLHQTQTVTELTDGQLDYQFQEFIRILGLLPLGIGREDYVTGVTGVIFLRDLLIKLFIEETGVSNKGGNLHLNRLITQEQKMILQNLPPLAPSREAVIRAYLAYAAAYLPRARIMAQKRDIPWPERFEEVTWQNLKRQLGIKKSY